MPIARDAQASAAMPKEPRNAPPRLDWLRIAFQVDLAPSALDEIRARASAERGGAIAVGAMEMSLARGRVPEKYVATNADLALVIDQHAQGGWNVTVQITALFLMRHQLSEAIALTRRVARSLGRVREERVRRIDLAVDVAGAELLDVSTETWMFPRGGGRLNVYEVGNDPDDDLAERVTFRKCGKQSRVTGLMFCPGSTIVGRIYDKRAELATRPADDSKTIAEFARLEVAGMMNGPVTRVEFQLQGAVLDDLKVNCPHKRATDCTCPPAFRDPDNLEDNIDSAWQYLTRRWLQRFVPDTATRRENCHIDPTWLLLQRVQFRHVAVPAKRGRRPGGATSRQALGTVISSLASSRRIRRIDRHGFDSVEAWVDSLTPRQAEQFVHDTFREIHVTQALHAAHDFLAEGERKNQSIHVIAKELARLVGDKSARAWSIDDEGRLDPVTWTAVTFVPIDSLPMTSAA